MKSFYRQRLPHIQPKGASFFVTFRLFGSIPYTNLKKLMDEYQIKIVKAKSIKDIKEKNRLLFNLRKSYFNQRNQLLHDIKDGPNFLSNDEIMAKTKEVLHTFDGELYKLICYCVMSNHVHILIDTSLQIDQDIYIETLEEDYIPLDKIMKRIKAPIARFANTHLNKIGQFWERESFDIYIRNERMLDSVISYILKNPVKANIVEKWEEYSGNYLKRDY